MNKLLCKIFGHHLSSMFEYGNPRFILFWDRLLNESGFLEVFIHKCKSCKELFEVFRLTKEAINYKYSKDIND